MDLDELPFSRLFTKLERAVALIGFLLQWPEGLWVITLFRKEGGNLWCELRPRLGQARVRDGW